MFQQSLNNFHDHMLHLQMIAPPPPPATSVPSTGDGRIDAPQAQHPSQVPRNQNPLGDAEMSVLRECQSESFWYRSLPLSGLLAAGTHFAVQQGIMRPNPNYGARPKVILGVIVGYFVGKFSYADACADKFLVQAPDSDIAEAVRQRRGLPLRHPERAAERQKERELHEQQWQQPQQQLGNNGAPARNMREAQLRQQQQWAQQHVQEQQQLQQQREAEGQLGAGLQPGESYDELRKRNRMTPGYQAGAMPNVPASADPQQQGESSLFQQLNIPPPPPYNPPPASSRQGGSSNKYGDEGFE